MDFLNLAQARYSVRTFDDQPIEKEKIHLILEAARVSPTAMNYQSQRILVVDRPDLLERIKRCYPYQIAMPMAMLVCYDRSISAKRPSDHQDFGIVDATIAAVHIMFAASSLGLGTTFTVGFEPKRLQEELSLPVDIIPVALLPIGYPAKDSTFSHSHMQRLDISKTTCYNFFPTSEHK